MLKQMMGLMALVSMGTGFAAQAQSLQDVHTQLYGNTIAAPSAESEIGKYLAETHASYVVRKFPTAPVGSVLPKYELGPEKLVVAVSAETFESFKKHFSSANMLYQVYEPNAMAMVVGFEGKRGTEGMLRDQLNARDAGTLMIPILLDSNEGARAKQFFSLAEVASREAASPWRLRNDDGVAYSAMSAFQGCTHWFGGMPLGNKLVDTYYFPHGEEDERGENPNHKTLSAFTTPGMPDDLSALLHKVWQVPGYQQLGEMLKPEAFRRGEFANPGWIAYTLLGSVATERTPVVFLMVDDEKAPLPADFALHISAQ